MSLRLNSFVKNQHLFIFDKRHAFVNTVSSKRFQSTVLKDDPILRTQNGELITDNDSELSKTGYDGELNKTDYDKLRVFKKKDTSELLRSWLVLKLSSINTIVNNSEKLVTVGKKVLPTAFFHKILDYSFFSQFVIGNSIQASLTNIDTLKKKGIKSMLCVPTESRTDLTNEERKHHFDANYEIIKECCYGTAQVDPEGFAQAKVTAICEKDLLIEMNPYLLQYETSHKESGDWLFEKNVAMLEKNSFEDMYFNDLSPQANQQFQRCIAKLDSLAQTCKDLNIRLMLDAEQTYLQASLGYIILLLQAKYNKEKAVVYNTYQCYRKDTLKRVTADLQLSKDFSFKLACKIVRGAYMLEERHLAEQNGLDDPINNTYDDTNMMYHSVVDELLPLVKNNQSAIMVATHNEDTVDYVMKRMNELGISKEQSKICFGQLYGMCDHVSYFLGMNGFQTFKSTPFGGYDDCLLYLARRAHENKSVLHRTILERSLIKRELFQRVMPVLR